VNRRRPWRTSRDTRQRRGDGTSKDEDEEDVWCRKRNGRRRGRRKLGERAMLGAKDYPGNRTEML
jgi:hypothetical protein